MDNSKHIVIIGGGITGLSAAWELQGRGHTAYTLLEQDSRWGGKVITAQRSAPAGGNFIIDGGPESFITRKPEVWELAHELGIQHQLATPGSETSHMFILTQGKPLAVPLNPVLFLTSPILSARGKLRMLVEPFCPPRRDGEDESLAEFVTRRLGREALDRFIGPVLAGIYNTDPERQSILTTSPIMREMEAEYGGLFKAVLGRRRKKSSQAPGSARPRFITFSAGCRRPGLRAGQPLAGRPAAARRGQPHRPPGRGVPGEPGRWRDSGCQRGDPGSSGKPHGRAAGAACAPGCPGAGADPA
jgi:protoporphyrinogen/coproporphyrinogen III oxidase